MNPWWQTWQTNQDWRDKLAKKASYKTLDIPPDDMNIVNSTGIGAKGVVGAVLAASVAPAALAYALTREPAETPTAPPTDPPPVTDTDTDTQYRFETRPGGSQ